MNEKTAISNIIKELDFKKSLIFLFSLIIDQALCFILTIDNY
jgi:hypothetical protein